MLTEQQMVSVLPNMRRFARTLDRAGFEDLAQEAALRCWKERASFDGVHDPVHLALRIVYSTYVRFIKARIKSPLANSRTIDETILMGRAHHPRAEQLVELRETLTVVRRHPYGGLVERVAVETAGLSGRVNKKDGVNAHIAKELGVTPNYLAGTLFKARRQIRAQMEGRAL